MAAMFASRRVITNTFVSQALELLGKFNIFVMSNIFFSDTVLETVILISGKLQEVGTVDKLDALVY